MGILQGDSTDSTASAMYWQYGNPASSSHLSSSAALPESDQSPAMMDGSSSSQAVDPKEDSKGKECGIVCAGCESRICDRFYLVAVDKAWHSSCLRCCQCRCTFETALSCFAKESRIYCKNDYYRLFGTKHCAKCELVLEPDELVMRARDSFYHTRCFSCHTCNTHLTKGSTFGMLDTRIFCKDHYHMITGDPSLVHASTNPLLAPEPGHNNSNNSNPHEYAEYPFLCHSNGYPATNPMAYPLGFDPMMGSPPVAMPTGGVFKSKNRKRRSNKDQLHDGHVMNSMGDCVEGPGCAPTKTKRMRTSFKHHQLRMLKSYFATNHNPDAKDLKQLSQKTSLSKRVLQVWFQNARAKWRRLTHKQDGGGGSINNDIDGGSPGFGYSSMTMEDALISTSRNSMSVYEEMSLSGSSSASMGFPSPL